MTPEEAIEIIEKQIVNCEAMIDFNENFDPEEDNTKFLKEKEALLMAVKSIKEVQRYREIGTVKEYRDARNMQTPEAPEYEGNGCDKDGNIIYDTWICPNCGERYEVDYDDYEHCPKCGKAILHENLEV